ncbi:MAG TPA: ABC transporter substrate-binding protein [Desulfuromonadales bacterium]|nr:ABC transporter substrate-binding protein [Desulfuromonadales bacterium]
MKSILYLVVCCGVMLLVGGQPAFGATGPQTQLEKSVNQILQLLRDETLQDDVRKKQITDLVRQRFTLRVMSQYVLGPQWRTTSEEERERFVTLFSDLLEASYVDKINAYNDEEVSFVGEQIRENRASVETLILTGSKEIPIEYRLVDANGEWLVYDVIVEGVSLVRNYRSSYREIVRKDGMAKLLDRMEEKLVEIRQREKKGAS